MTLFHLLWRFLSAFLRSVLAIAAALLAFAWVAHGSDGRSSATYDSKQRYSKGAAIKYPDFTLTYLGSRRVSSPVYKHGFRFEDFRVADADGKASKVVSWSSGAGDIGPVAFEFNNHGYLLELVFSDKGGRLKSDEVVVSRR